VFEEVADSVEDRGGLEDELARRGSRRQACREGVNGSIACCEPLLVARAQKLAGVEWIVRMVGDALRRR
jgi:hypothetical protein